MNSPLCPGCGEAMDHDPTAISVRSWTNGPKEYVAGYCCNVCELTFSVRGELLSCGCTSLGKCGLHRLQAVAA